MGLHRILSGGISHRNRRAGPWRNVADRKILAVYSFSALNLNIRDYADLSTYNWTKKIFFMPSSMKTCLYRKAHLKNLPQKKRDDKRINKQYVHVNIIFRTCWDFPAFMGRIEYPVEINLGRILREMGRILSDIRPLF